MSTALERRLQRALGRLPQPNRDATRRARGAALATLPPEERRGGLVLLFVAAAVAVAVAAGAGALAATGNLHVRLGEEQPRPKPAPPHLQVPRGTHGIALVAGGRLWLVTRGGLRIEDLPVSTAELSPRALYAAVGIGSSLVALAPGGRKAWSHDAGGRVVAAAWSPDGLKIAYVVSRNGSNAVRLIEGDGDNDRSLARAVAPVRPVWRRDSLAVTYVRRDGRRVLADFSRGRVSIGTRYKRQAHVTAPSPGPDGRVAMVVPKARGWLELWIVTPRYARTLLRVRALGAPAAVSWR